MSTKLNEFENATVGMATGGIEVMCLQPLNYMKNMAQQNVPIEWNIRVMYRGVSANVLNMGSCTMLQFAVGGALKKQILGDDPRRKLKVHEEIGAALCAGIFSATVGSPLELIMIQQQRKGGSTMDTIRNIANPSTVGRGFFGTAVREGLWTVGYLSIPPITIRNLRASFPETFDSDAKARLPGSLIGGFVGCYMTHPFDTMKTCMQGDIERKNFKGIFHTANQIYQESGVTGFYRGATYRYGRMCIAVGLIDWIQSQIGPLFYPHKFN